MHFRALRKTQGDVSLSDALDGGDEGSALSLMDVIAVDDTMLEDLDTRDSCIKVRSCVAHCLSPREQTIITMRYGLDGTPPKTQREVASQCGISRSYAPVNIGTNIFHEKGHLKTQVSFFFRNIF